MLEGINIRERVTFVYSGDKKPETEIVIRPLTSFEMMKVSATTSTGDFSELIQLSVVEIKNPDITDNVKVCEFVASLQIDVLTELMAKITAINSFSDDEIKN